MLIRHILAVCVVFCLLSTVDAQVNRRRQGGRNQQPKTEPFAAKGVIEAVARDRIQIMTDTEQRWMIFIDPKAVVHVIGTAAPEFLGPGLFVKFSADFDKRGKAKEKVKKLAIFTPMQEMDIGYWPEGMAPVAAEPGAKGGADDGGGEGFGGAAPGADAQPSSIYTVHGQIRGNRKGKLTVATARASFQIEMAEEPEIAVDFNNFLVAKKGDKISITKGKMYAGRLGMAQALEMSIQLSEKLGVPKKPTRRQPAKATSRRPKKEDAKKEEPKGEQPKKDEPKEGTFDSP